MTRIFVVLFSLSCLAACNVDDDTGTTNNNNKFQFEEPEAQVRTGQQLCSAAGTSSNENVQMTHCLSPGHLSGTTASNGEFTLQTGTIEVTRTPAEQGDSE